MKTYSKKMDYAESLDFVERNRAALKLLYIKKDLTARIVAEKLNIHYDQNFQKALFRVFGSKGKGLGGQRQGSGMKKGTVRCKTCRNKIDNCKCK